ncbi:transferase hexapeptide repeat-containing protein, partial [Anaeromyces robustus]
MATEKEKMLAGELYDSGDKQLVQERLECRKVLKKFNDAEPEEVEKRAEYCRNLFKKFGKDAYIEPPFRCDYGSNISMGDRSYMNFDTIVLDVCEVTIGEDCLFGPGCRIITATHPLDYRVRKNFGKEYGKPIKIGNDCFFGANCTILPGVTIGDRVVVGAGSVVTKNVESDSI